MKDSSDRLGASFGWLNITQFLGAFNDNVFKLLVIFFMIRLQGPDKASTITALAGAVFVMPFLLFSALAGKIADSTSKRDVIVAVKFAELILMILAVMAFAADSGFGVYLVLFLMAAQSAFFAPSKYGIIPELVKDTQLSRANGVIEAFVYLAIILGTAAGFVFSQMTGSNFVLMGGICVGVAFAGLMTSFFITHTASAGAPRDTSLVFVRDIWHTLWLIRRNRFLLLAVIASAYFLFIGALIYNNLIPYSIDQLGLEEKYSSLPFVVVAVGIGLGAFWAGKLSGRNVEFGVVPFGALGMTVFSIGLGFLGTKVVTACVLMFLVGLSGGLFIVPVYAFIQLRSPNKRRGQILAASGFLGWCGVLLASGLTYLFSGLLGMQPSHMFVVLGLLTLILSIAAMVLLPDFFVRFLIILLTKFCYRIRVVGGENIPAKGGVLIVSNHVSWADAALIGATQQRMVRFIMDKSFYNKKLLRPICKLMLAIPISSDDPPKQILRALKQARKMMDDGDIVCIFAEGAMTRNGMLRSFKSGFERIMKDSNYSVVPAYIGGAWGSIFSYYLGKPLSTFPGKLNYPISIHFGQPMQADSTALQIRQKVLELSCDYYSDLKSKRRSLGESFITAARRNWHKHAISDSTGKRLKYGQLLTAANFLSEKINQISAGQEKVGVLLPPSAAGALANIAIALAGRVAVNLNYVASPQARALAIQQSRIKTIITSRKFTEKLSLESLDGLVFVEDIFDGFTIGQKIKSYLRARFAPRWFFKTAKSADALAAVIYSSGSSGRSKGVMLSHYNIISNIEAAKMVFQIQDNDNICAPLPFFHSFGFTCTLWLPLLSGVSASFCANPLDGATVGKMARENRSTLLFGAPTFLLNYCKRAEKEDFASLRFVVVGAEKLKKRIANSFEEKFGLRPLEGYGATELSPVASLNLPDRISGGVHQVGNKAGTVGHPLPGVAVKVVGVEDKVTLPADGEGLLLVKGPNVMLGYLDMPDETAKVLQDGWYDTGDVARIDEDGFITLTDRLSRFSKIGGEMVPHVGVEEILLNALDTEEQVIAVTSVPDEKKGEELVVLYLEKAGDADKLFDIISQSDIQNMWKPKRSNYVKVDFIPILGSGKLDILHLKKLAQSIKQSTE
ncbi:MAG: acyl-[ACP]--phospholipid O-acyltransferase [Phycisphaerae bacterium]|nr:acyl-[ACP]--phospholipid O-acyltransferase [Phycisphaerae bacterium]